MTGRAGKVSRGRPLATLAMLMAIWIGGRALLWESPFADAGVLAGAPAPILAEKQIPATAVLRDQKVDWSVSSEAVIDSPAAYGPLLPEPEPLPEAPFTWPEAAPGNSPATASMSNPQVAASHQLMWMAALAHMPVPDVLSQRVVTPTGPHRAKPAPQAIEGRWSLDAWVLWRQGSSGSLVSQGRVPSYGASQAGAALSYRLAPANRHDPRAYMRLYHALIDRGEGEVALGLNARPMERVPLRAYAELRATRLGDDSTGLRPAAFVATEFAPQKLPAGFRGELYLQGGYVGGKASTGFADGQLHVLRDVKRFDLAQLSLGGAAWGGAQKGAHRLDLGPTVQADITLGRTPARLSVDWRERVAGNAEPDSGLAVTLSTRF